MKPRAIRSGTFFTAVVDIAQRGPLHGTIEGFAQEWLYHPRCDGDRPRVEPAAYAAALERSVFWSYQNPR
jgi:hypothetical protein